MTSPTAFMDDVVTLVEGLTPPTDGSGDSYACIDTFTEERGHGQHREFMWIAPDRVRVADDGLQRNREWDTGVVLFIHQNDRTYDAFARGISDEIDVIKIGIEQKTNWSSGVLDPILEEIEVEDAEPGEGSSPRAGSSRNSGAVKRVTFPVRVLIQGT